MDTIPKQEPYIQPLSPKWYSPYVAKLDMLRLDVIHPIISGNKWYKLKNNIAIAKTKGHDTIVTFGGAYSNHLIATAATAKAHGLQAIGIVRGTYSTDNTTQTLKDCIGYGMQLHFVSREEYDLKYDEAYLSSLQSKYPNALIIPEGGANENGVEGCKEIATYISDTYTHICLSCGTGTTLAGIRNVLPQKQNVLGYVPMKGGGYIKNDIDKYLAQDKRALFILFDDWHCGGFGKHTEELIDFMNIFYSQNDIALDMVYTGKMMMGIQKQLASGFFAENARLLCIHTGGLQGNVAIKDKLIY